jgi:hypothetical protein
MAKEKWGKVKLQSLSANCQLPCNFRNKMMDKINKYTLKKGNKSVVAISCKNQTSDAED